jgi:8-oxo-dGDP phosphatase
VEVSLIDVELPDGERSEHHVVRLPSAVAVVVLDDAKRVLMIWRHRFISDRWGWELPSDLVDPGEAVAETAAREVEEETGWRPREMVQAVGFQPMVGTVDSPHAVFISHAADHVGGDVDPTEATRIDWLPLDGMLARIESGEIWTAGSIVGLLYALAHGSRRERINAARSLMCRRYLADPTALGRSPARPRCSFAWSISLSAPARAPGGDPTNSHRRAAAVTGRRWPPRTYGQAASGSPR